MPLPLLKAETPIRFPQTGRIAYSASTIQEKLESHTFERIYLDGPRPIQSPVIPGLAFHKGQQSDVITFYRDGYPDTYAKLVAFPLSHFAPALKVDYLNRYLKQRKASSSPELQFTITEPATVNNGKAKFRFLGGKAITQTYEFMKTDSKQRHRRFRCCENWRLSQGVFYVFIVEAPVETFDAFYALVRGEAGQIHFTE